MDITARLRRLYVDHGTNYVQEAADEIERLRARLEINPDTPGIDGIYCRDRTIELHDAEIKKLRETVKNLENMLDFERGSLRAAFASVDSLRAEVEALRKDAARYRWLREERFDDDLPSVQSNCTGCIGATLDGDYLDSAIDRAISEQALQRMTDEAQADGVVR